MPDIPSRLTAALASRYRIEREIGSGGMATVYLAQDQKHHRSVAIKVLNPDLTEALGADRFLREIEIAANLHHPHVMPLYDSGKDGGFLYYVMPYEEGRSLRDRLVKEGELPVEDAVRLLRDVADALAHAHQRGVVHRDIKPDNVLLSGRHALVTDFGVAKAVSEAAGRRQLTTAGVVLGTPAYMAPEQASGEEHIDHRADIYAFGALAYELLTGEPPFTRPSAQAVLAAQVTEAPSPVTARRASVPGALANLIMRCLEKKPADRWQTAEEMLLHLEAMATPSGRMQPTTVVSAPRGKARRMPLWAILTTSVIIAVGAVIFWPRGSTSTVIPSATRIAILPLAPAVQDEALSRLGRNLVVLLASNLDGVGDITTVDPNVILVRSDELGRVFTLEEGIDLARTFGAGSVLHGNLVRVGENVRVDAQLIRTDDEATVARLSSAGSAGDIAALADSTTWALLEEVWRARKEAPTPHVAARMTTSFESLRAFLEGEEAHRDGRYQRAWEAYERAFTADSTFWLAYWRYDAARSWMGLSVDPAISAAWQAHVDEFPKLDRELVEARETQPSSARTEALRRFAEGNPDYYPGWWRYGDLVLHGYTRTLGAPLSEAIRAFERVVELNPRMIPAWEHLLFCYAVERDLEKARWALGEMHQRGGQEAVLEGYGYDEVTYYRLLFDLWQGNRSLAQVTDTVTLLAREARRVNTLLLPVWARMSALLGSPSLQIEVNRRVAREPGANDPEDLLLAEAYAWASRGAWDSALVVAEEHSRVTGAAGTSMRPFQIAVVGALYGGVEGDEARRHRPDVDLGSLTLDERARQAWYDGILGYATKDRMALSEARIRLEAMDTAATEYFERSLAGFELELGGDRGGARQALAQLVEVEADSSSAPWFVDWNQYAVHRTEVARWLREAGDPQRALRFLEWQKCMTPSVLGVEAAILAGPFSYLEMARAEDDLGYAGDALKHYYEFLRRYDMPPPQHMHLVEEARDAVERLGGGAS